MRRALVVVLEADTPTAQANGIMHAIATGYPGVASVANLGAIDRETLDCLLMQSAPAAPKPVGRKRHQAALFGEDAT